jgi:hypothetical protein
VDCFHKFPSNKGTFMLKLVSSSIVLVGTYLSDF